MSGSEYDTEEFEMILMQYAGEVFSGKDEGLDRSSAGMHIKAKLISYVQQLQAEVERLKQLKGDPVVSFEKHMEYMRENSLLKAELEKLKESKVLVEVAALQIVKAKESLQAELTLTKNQLQTITNDRDAEQSMKAKARQQRDAMTKKVQDATDLLRIAECYLKTAGHTTLATQIGWFLNPSSVVQQK